MATLAALQLAILITLARVISTQSNQRRNIEKVDTPSDYITNIIREWLARSPSLSIQPSLKCMQKRPSLANKTPDSLQHLLTILLIVSGDIQLNPGPRQASVYPCGFCELKVGWSTLALCCDNCDVWYHKDCLSLSNTRYSLLGKSNVSWICLKCTSMNVDSFTYHSHCLDLTNTFNILNRPEISTIDTPCSDFAPTFFSSPVLRTCQCNISTRCPKECCRSNLQEANSRNKLSNTRKSGPCRRCNNPSYHTDNGARSKSCSTQSGDTTSTGTNNTSTTVTLEDLLPAKGNNWRTLIVNCRSLNANKGSLNPAVGYINPDCIIGTESWLNPNIKDSEVMPEGYTAFRKDRDDSRGGAFIAIKDVYNSSLIQSQGEHSEIVWTEVEIDKAPNLMIGSYYRAPSSSIESINDLRQSLEALPTSSTTKTIILGGDFNAPDVNWDIPAVNDEAHNKSIQEDLILATNESELNQLQEKPTRGDNILDLFFTNNTSLLKYIDVVPGISDHDMVVVDQDLRPVYNKPKQRKIYKFKQANWSSIKEEAAQLSDEIVSDAGSTSVNNKWLKFKNGITKIMDKYIPSKFSSSRFNVPWLNRSLKKNIRKKYKLLKKARVTPNEQNWSKYKKHKRLTQKALRTAQLNYISSTLEESFANKNPKPFWRFIKSKKKDNVGVAPIKNNGKLFSDSKSKAELLNKQFESVFTIDTSSELPDINRPEFPEAPEITIHTEGVINLLNKLQTSKASGPDNIPNKILKETSSEIGPALTVIFQQSIDTGTLPDDWTTANIAPVFKKGSKHEAVNYRPVSLTCVCCKVLEHIVCKSILDHFDLYKILSILQHGFRKCLSCETQLLLTIHDLTSMFDQKKQVDMAILDFSKAFDTVPHERLLHKLHHYGIRKSTLAWIRAFLTNRTQRVVIEGVGSDPVTVKSGVPQGTVLGPLLFLAFINDLPDHVLSQVRLFADDCLLYRPITSEQDHIILQQDLDALQKWADTWGMRFNAKKCYILRISRARTPSTTFYQLNNQVLQQVQENPYLGILLSEDLKWSKHVIKTSKKAYSVLGFLRRNLKQCNLNIKSLAYKSLVRSILEYSATIWDPHLKKDTHELERVQR